MLIKQLEDYKIYKGSTVLVWIGSKVNRGISGPHCGVNYRQLVIISMHVEPIVQQLAPSNVTSRTIDVDLFIIIIIL